MGLIWSLKAVQDPKARKGLRLMQKDVTKPMTVTYSLSYGHLQYDDYRYCMSVIMLRKMRCWCFRGLPPALGPYSVSVQRSYMGTNVTRIKISTGRLRGALYLPNGDAIVKLT